MELGDPQRGDWGLRRSLSGSQHRADGVRLGAGIGDRPVELYDDYHLVRLLRINPSGQIVMDLIPRNCLSLH